MHADCRGLLRLLAGFVLLSLLPLAVLAYTGIDASERAVRREVETHLVSAARLTATLVEREAEGLLRLVDAHARRPALVAGFGGGDPAQFDRSVIEPRLEQLVAAQPGISGAFVTDISGRATNVVPPTPEIVGRDFSRRDWYRGLEATGGPYMSEAYQAAIAGNPVVVAAAAYVRTTPNTLDDGGDAVGILVLFYDLDAIGELARTVSPLAGVEVTVTDQQGTVLAAPGPPAPALISKRHDPVVAAALQGRSGVSDVASPGGGEVVAFAPVANTGWTVSASIDEREAFAGMARTRSRVLTVTALLGLVLMGGLVQLVRVQRRRAAAEATLRATDARTRAILTGARDGFFSIDPDRRITDWNPRAAELFGWTPEEALGSALGARILPAGSGGGDEVALGTFLAGGDGEVTGRSLEVTVVTRSGEEVPVEISLFSSPSGDGYWHGFVRDLRERTRAQQALAQLAAIVEFSDDAVIGTTLDGLIHTWNRGAESLYGYSAEEAVGQPVSMLVPPGADDELADVVARFHRGETVGQYETRRLRADGTTVEVSVTDSPVRDATGTIVGISRISRDVTARKQTEVALQAARDEAMEASRQKSEFLANMSHEIRTPINGVLGMTSLLLDTDLDAEQRDYAETAKRSGEALLRVINDILDFSTVEAGRLEFQHVDFDLRKVVEDATLELAEAAEEKRIELACLVPPDLSTQVRGDPGRLRQVLTNLLSNALKFTAGGGEVVVTVGVAQDGAVDADDDVLMAFEVRDTGMGIAPEYLDRLFDSFSQGDASTTRPFGGTGLGLAISRRLVELMDGSISVDSEVGRGSTFRFTARFAKVAEGQAEPRRQPRLDLVGLRVLVVDDHATNRMILTQMLHAWSMRATEACGGGEALALLRAAADRGAPYDLVILDRNMPEIDGLEVARRVREDPALLGITRIVMLSSSPGRAEAKRAGELGIDGYLAKPVRQSQFYDCVATVMGDATPTRHMVTANRSGPAPGTRLLLVEDNPVNCKVAVRSLEKMGYQVDVAANGAEALPAAFRGDYAAILMDCQMPVMDGYEATATIRRGEQTRGRHTPIIAMTASAMEGDRERCLAAGMDDYLAKPLRSEALAAVLARWLGAAPGEEAEVTAPAPRAAELDSEILSHLVGMDESADFGLLEEVVDLLSRDTPPRLAQMRQAVATGDAPALRQAAHALKGSAATVGATAMAAMSARLEDLGRTGELDGAGALLDELSEEVPLVIEALRAAGRRG